ncbi:MAG: hypothetical protein ABSA92_11020 [Candidatus Bathyarchaeia archaeon]|jgi:hypothetical protein
MSGNQTKLTPTALLEEARELLKSDTPPKLRNAGRSLCDAFKLFLAEVGGAVYGYDLVSNLSIKLRFAFLVQGVPELKEFSSLVAKLDTLRQKTEHSDTFFMSKKKLDEVLTEVDKLLRKRDPILSTLRSKTAKVDLEIQRGLLIYFLNWLEEEFSGLSRGHESTVAEEPPLDEVSNAKKLLALRSKVAAMDHETVNENILAVREAIASIDELWSDLDEFRRS